MPRRRANPRIAIESCHCERGEAISHCCTEIATHPAGARNDDRNQVIAKSSAVFAADCKDKASNGKAGFSLLELLITALILTVVLLAIYLMYETNMITATWGNKKAELQQNARVALDMMQRETRMAGYDPSNAACGAIKSGFSEADLTLFADIDGNNVTDKVQYTFNQASQTITRRVQPWDGSCTSPTTTAETVADGVSSLSLTYKDGADSVTTQPASVRKITIAIIASGQAGNKTQTFTFASDVRLRNCINPPTCN